MVSVRDQHLDCPVEIASLPIIDLESFVEGDAATKQQISQAAVDACESAGFFYVSGHGIEEQVFESAKRAALEFFRMPSEYKGKVHISQFPHHRGYVGHHDVYPDVSKGGDIREAYKVALDLSEDDPDYQAGITLYGPNVWPQEMPEFKEALSCAYDHFQVLSSTIFRLFAVGLGQTEEFFAPLLEKPASVMNVNYYAPVPQDGVSEPSGIGAHNDYEAFAMLWQDGVKGLQIQSLSGEWQAVEPVPQTLVINIGELMQHWTNDRFRATPHRVINVSGRERVSLACFGNTNYHALIECIDSCCSADEPARYPPVLAGDYLMAAIKRTYAYA